MPRLASGDARLAPPGDRCAGMTFLECYARLDLDLGADAPMPVTAPSGATAVVLPTPPMIAVALVNVTLTNLKARNEERHLLAMHGESYAAYLAGTGRFLPRLFAPRA